MSDKKTLPPDWVVKLSTTRRRGKVYYFNTKTSESSWDFPEEGSVRGHRRKISESDASDVLKSPSSHKENSHKRKKTSISNSETSSVYSHKSKHQIKHRKPSKSVASKIDRSKEGKDETTTAATLPPLPLISKNAESSTLKDLPTQGSKGREVRVAEWISTVNQNFEPSEQGTVKSDSCLSSPETDFGSVIDNYVHSARVGLDVLGPRKTTREDYVPLYLEDNRHNKDNHKNLLKSSEGCLKPKEVEEQSTKRYSSPLSNTTQNSNFSNLTSSSANHIATVQQPNSTQSSTLRSFSFKSTTPPQATPSNPSPRFCRPLSASPPASYGEFSNSSSTLSRNTLIPNSGAASTSTPQEFNHRSTTPTSTFVEANFGFFRQRSASPPDQPITRVSSVTNLPMMVDSSPVVSFDPVNRSAGGVLESSGISVPQKPAFNTINPSNGIATPGCVSVDSGCVSFSEEVVGMEVDCSEELEEHIRQELQMVRTEFVIDAVKVQEKVVQSQDLISHQSYADTLYIVLDTNVLLSHLKFVSELKDYPVEGTGRPVLVVPWIVLQELDSLKSDAWKIRQGKIIAPQNKNGAIGVDSLARQAIKFLHTCFDNKHPRMRGQTLAEFSEEINTFPEESNDDRILQCCLLFKKKADKGHAVLFSNDQNLCNKALVNGIKAFNHQTLIGGLRELFKSSALVPLTQDSFTEFYDQLRKQEELADKRAKADDIMCELQCVMREGLSVIMETEMRAAYDNLWETIVFIKPPWTLRDLIHCLNKHWIAVFGHILSRDVKPVVDELKKHFDLEKGVPGCLSNVSKVVTLTQKLFNGFATKSSYGGAITKCLAAIMVLQKKCNDYQLAALPAPNDTKSVPTTMAPPPPPQPRNFPAIQHHNMMGSAPSVTESTSGRELSQNGELSDDQTETASIGSSAHTKISTSAAHSQPHTLVLKTFDVIWNAVTQFSAQIFGALQYPNPIPVNIVDNLPRPSRDEAILFLGRLCPCLSAVVTGIQSVLRIPLENPEGEQPTFEVCVRAVRQFLQEILSMESAMTAEDLCTFCQDPSTRDGLIKGGSQLDRALATLQHCSSCVAASNFP